MYKIRFSLIFVMALVLACGVPASGALVRPTVASSSMPESTVESAELCAVVAAEVAVHLRAGRGSDTSILAHLARGERVTVLDRSGEWWEVRHAGLRGYVRSKYLEVCDE